MYSFICNDNRIHLIRIAFLGHSPILHEKYPVRESIIESNDDMSIEQDDDTFEILQKSTVVVCKSSKKLELNYDVTLGQQAQKLIFS